MCDSLIGNGSAKWQAQQWPGATSLNSGSFSEQMPCAIGQRVWKRQPVGGSSGDGGSPARMMRLRVFWISGSGTGTADSKDLEYGCRRTHIRRFRKPNQRVIRRRNDRHRATGRRLSADARCRNAARGNIPLHIQRIVPDNGLHHVRSSHAARILCKRQSRHAR